MPPPCPVESKARCYGKSRQTFLDATGLPRGGSRLLLQNSACSVFRRRRRRLPCENIQPAFRKTASGAFGEKKTGWLTVSSERETPPRKAVASFSFFDTVSSVGGIRKFCKSSFVDRI